MSRPPSPSHPPARSSLSARAPAAVARHSPTAASLSPSRPPTSSSGVPGAPAAASSPAAGVSYRRVLRAVAAVTSVSVPTLLSRSLDPRHCRARQLAMLALYRLPRWSLPRVGEALGRNHTTVLAGIRRAEARPETDALLAEVDALLGRRA